MHLTFELPKHNLLHISHECSTAFPLGVFRVGSKTEDFLHYTEWGAVAMWRRWLKWKCRREGNDVHSYVLSESTHRLNEIAHGMKCSFDVENVALGYVGGNSRVWHDSVYEHGQTALRVHSSDPTLLYNALWLRAFSNAFINPAWHHPRMRSVPFMHKHLSSRSTLGFCS